MFCSRGKKVFRKFSDPQEAEDEDEEVEAEDQLAEDIPDTLQRPLTRSSIKPRLLFPSVEQTKAKKMRSQMTEDEEEAITDIEEPSSPMEMEVDSTDNLVSTPKMRKIAPATPPTTARATRSRKVDMDGSLGLGSDDEVPSPDHVDSGRRAKLSPFDSWSRIKRHGSGSKKREGDSMTRASKKTKG
jgi:hypothetical protein